MKLSMSQLGEIEQKYTNAKKSVQRAREEARDTVMAVVRSVEVGGTAFSFGIINGRWGRPELLGIPVDLGGSLALHGLGFIMDKEIAGHLHNLGDGAMASYLTSLGTGIGAKMLQESTQAQQQLAPNAP
jgi:hypothetical protein